MMATVTMPLKQLSKPPLSRREENIAGLVADGLTNREIAERLFISERTVDSHLEHVREKLAVNSRAQVAAWFVAQSQARAAVVTPPQARERHTNPTRKSIAVAALVILSMVAGLVAFWRLTTAVQTSHGAANPSAGGIKSVWSTNGADHLFSYPGSIALGDHGALYVLDRGNDRVQKLDSKGAYLTSWGRTGTGPGQLITYCTTGNCPPACISDFDALIGGPCARLPGSLAVDRAGRVWVFDYAGRVQVFDSSGLFLFQWGKKGSGQGEFVGPGFIAFDSKENVVISDGRRIQRFTPDGGYLGQIGSFGIAAGQYRVPGSLAVDSHDNLYVADFGGRHTNPGGTILKYDRAGRLAWSLSSAIVVGPQALVTDSNDNLWVLENPGSHLKQFDPGGRLLRTWSTSGFVSPFGLAVDANGDVFVTDLPGGDIPNEGRLSKVTPFV